MAASATPGSAPVEIEGRSLTLTNLDKVLYPAAGFTKAAVIDYYLRVAPVLLPHLHRRELTMVRWPDGVDGPSFFEKRVPPHAPDWVHRARSDPDLEQPVVDDLPTLIWVANLAALELHTRQSTADAPDAPTSLVLDLDPGAPAGVLDCAAVALALRGLLDGLGLTAAVKTSGGKGLHIGVPVRDATSEETKALARALGQLLQKRDPARVTVTMRKDLRRGKVFVDWSQNDRHKTTVAAYSLRANARPTVSTPVTWDEVADALAAGDADRLVFEAPAVLERVARLGDLYASNLVGGTPLPALGDR
ncbi:MAG: ATP-dependent DNA ligase [Actinobacteria bacterium]|nr:ATP-dependent DNA ligase [Actinomycetota bacterium]